MDVEEIKRHLKVETDDQKIAFLTAFLIRFRQELRKEKDYETADIIRDILKKIGVTIGDENE